MALYESIFILRSSLNEDAVGAVVDKMKQALTSRGATVVKADNWGKKKLAYEIQHDRRGIYVLLRFETTRETMVSELERLYRLEDPVMKFLTVRVEEDVPQEADNGESDGGGSQ